LSKILEIQRFWVDTDVCLDQRSCVIEAPDLLQDHLASGGPQIITTDLNDDAKSMQILNAAWACPVAAINIEFSDGEVETGNGERIKSLSDSLIAGSK
tara:strand:- start:1430 stop:1723 length:294 start_codon:yes stop_codon:yes gene_type:complete